MKKLLCILVCVFAALAFACDCGGTPVQVPVKLDLNGGTIEGDVVDYTATIGEELVVPDPVKTGYNFSGWTLGGSGVDVNLSSWTIEGDLVTIKAKWTAKTYTLTLDADGGVIDGGSEFKITYGSTAADLPVPTKAGYQFKGWKMEGVEGYIDGKFVWDIDAAATLKAEWEDVREVNFVLSIAATDKLVDSEGVELGDDANTGTIGFGMSTAGLPVAVRDGFAFVGWAYDADGEGEGEAELISDLWDIWSEEAVVLVPVFEAQKYTVTIDVTGQEDLFLGGEEVTANFTCEVSYGLTYTLPVLTKTDYEFKGWAIAGTENQGLAATGTWTIAGDVTIVPVWEIDVFALHFTGAGVTTQTIFADNDTGIAVENIPALEKAGYTFVGYNISNAEIAALRTETTLTATFTANSYTATFNANGGTASVQTKEFVYDQPMQLPTATKAGYKFEGWAKSATAVAKELNDGAAWNIPQDTTLYAVYTANVYTIKYIINTEFVEIEGLSTQEVAYGSAYTLKTPTWKNGPQGIEFDKWVIAGTDEEFVAGTWENRFESVELSPIFKNVPVYTVTIDRNGGAGATSATIKYANALSEIVFDGDAPTKQGYSIIGWIYDGQMYLTSDLWVIELEEGATLKAVWDYTSSDWSPEV